MSDLDPRINARNPARVYMIEPQWWYQIDGEPPVGPFDEQLAAGKACRAELMRRAKEREALK